MLSSDAALEQKDLKYEGEKLSKKCFKSYKGNFVGKGLDCPKYSKLSGYFIYS